MSERLNQNGFSDLRFDILVGTRDDYDLNYCRIGKLVENDVVIDIQKDTREQVYSG